MASRFLLILPKSRQAFMSGKSTRVRPRVGEAEALRMIGILELSPYRCTFAGFRRP